MRTHKTKHNNQQLRDLIKEVIEEQSWASDGQEDYTPTTFTEADRQMLTQIYDIVVLGGAKGGYGGGRLRSIPALGSIPD